MGLRAAIPVPLGLLPKHASYWLCVLLFRKSLHELLSLQGDTFLRFYPVSLMYCSAMQSRCASRGIIGSESKDQMACIIETTHGLLIAHLLETGWPVYPVNPRTVDRRRSASGAKTDTIDAYLLAKTGRADFADLHRLTPDSEKVAEQDALVHMQTRLVNQLTA